MSQFQRLLQDCGVNPQLYNEMIDLMEGFKGREEMLDYLRFLFRNEKELIEDGWFSESEFFEEVYSTVVVLAEELNKE